MPLGCQECLVLMVHREIMEILALLVPVDHRALMVILGRQACKDALV